MKKHWRVLAIPLLLVVVMITSSITLAEGDPELPIEMTGELNGAAYKIRVPADWYGTLLVYAHGYTMDPVPDPEAAFLGAEMEEMLLDHGYALAASGFRGAGWNVAEALEDTAQLTRFFYQEVAQPRRTILYGVSMGGIVTLKSIEEYPDLYSGAVPMCSDAAGALKLFNAKLDYALAYDAAFGWPAAWGEVADVRNDLSFYPEVWFAKVQTELFSPEGQFPMNYAKWEFVRMVSNLPSGGHYMPAGVMTMPNVVAMSYFMSAQRAEIEVRAGGPASSNIGHVYELTDNEMNYLAGIGITIAEIEDMLKYMNAKANTQAAPEAIAYLQQYGEYSGDIDVPVLMLHNVNDSIAPAEHTTVYLETLTAAGTEDLLIRIYSDLPGHCNFSQKQVLRTLATMDLWLKRGKPPKTVRFPASMDFNTDFEPGPWPQPPAD